MDNDTKLSIWLLAVVGFCCVMMLADIGSGYAMQQCKRTHSVEVCQHELNR